MLDVNDFEAKQIIMVLPNDGDKLLIGNDNLIVKDKDGKVKCKATCYRLFAIFIIGHTTITTALIERARKFGFLIILFTTYFRLYDVIGFKREANSLLHKKQYEYNSLEIAKYLVSNKIINQRRVIMSNRHKTDGDWDAINKLDVYINCLLSATTLNDIMAYEGLSAKNYFKSIFSEYNWEGRRPRVKSDYINSLLDIGYTVLFAYIEAILDIYGFDLYCGVMHTMFYMRKSLVCDIMEPFRPIIDKQIKKSINLKQFKSEDFVFIDNRYDLEWKKSAGYVSIFLTSILQYKREIFIYIRQYYRAFMQGKPISEYPKFILEV